MPNIWRRQPTNRLSSAAFIPCDVTDTSVAIANEFFEAPPIVETIVAQTFPMHYIAKPVGATMLISKLEGATITEVDRSLGKVLVRLNRKELLSKWS